MPQPLLFRIIDKAVFDYRMIEPGDRILVGASGGKDSSVLVEYFANRVRRQNAGFEFKALHIETEITPGLNTDLVSLFADWGVIPEHIKIPVLGRLKPGRQMNCWWCSTQRRTELLQYAIAYRYNKIALGHHLDDILETLLMNVLYRGELSTMPPRLTYKKYPVTIIRPLYYAGVDLIRQHAEERGYINTTCTCRYQENSGRKEARSRLRSLTDDDPVKKEKILLALGHVESEYLP